jgi:transcriptional regulator with XRE-family HTH domain
MLVRVFGMEMEARFKLQFLRKREGLTQHEMAKKLDITKQYLSEIERGVRPPGRVLARVINMVSEQLGEPIDMAEWWVE